MGGQESPKVPWIRGAAYTFLGVGLLLSFADGITVTTQDGAQIALTGSNYHGNPLIQRETYVTGLDRMWIMHEIKLPMGYLKKFLFYVWEYNARLTNKVYVQIWRPQNLPYNSEQDSSLTLVWEHMVTVNLNTGGTLYTVNLDDGEQFLVKEGDVIGWTTTEFLLPFACSYSNVNDVYLTSYQGTLPTILSTHIFGPFGGYKYKCSAGVVVEPVTMTTGMFRGTTRPTVKTTTFLPHKPTTGFVMTPFTSMLTSTTKTSTTMSTTTTKPTTTTAKSTTTTTTEPTTIKPTTTTTKPTTTTTKPTTTTTKPTTTTTKPTTTTTKPTTTTTKPTTTTTTPTTTTKPTTTTTKPTTTTTKPTTTTTKPTTTTTKSTTTTTTPTTTTKATTTTTKATTTTTKPTSTTTKPTTTTTKPTTTESTTMTATNPSSTITEPTREESKKPSTVTSTKGTSSTSTTTSTSSTTLTSTQAPIPGVSTTESSVPEGSVTGSELTIIIVSCVIVGGVVIVIVVIACACACRSKPAPKPPTAGQTYMDFPKGNVYNYQPHELQPPPMPPPGAMGHQYGMAPPVPMGQQYGMAPTVIHQDPYIVPTGHVGAPPVQPILPPGTYAPHDPNATLPRHLAPAPPPMVPVMRPGGAPNRRGPPGADGENPEDSIYNSLHESDFENSDAEQEDEEDKASYASIESDGVKPKNDYYNSVENVNKDNEDYENVSFQEGSGGSLPPDARKLRDIRDVEYGGIQPVYKPSPNQPMSTSVRRMKALLDAMEDDFKPRKTNKYTKAPSRETSYKTMGKLTSEDNYVNSMAAKFSNRAGTLQHKSAQPENHEHIPLSYRSLQKS